MYLPNEYIRVIPYMLQLIVWLVALIVALRIIKKEPGRAEQFFLIGVSLNIVGILLIVAWVIIFVMNGNSLPGIIISNLPWISVVHECAILAGIICLVYAFWIKFKAKA